MRNDIRIPGRWLAFMAGVGLTLSGPGWAAGANGRDATPATSGATAAASGVTAPGAGTASPAPPWGDARVIQAPDGFSWKLAEVTFREPRRISVGAGNALQRQVMEVTVTGRDFRPADTGPVVYLNGIPTLRTTVAEDGSSLQALFYVPLQELEAAAARLGRWEVVVQAHAGVSRVYRVRAGGSGQGAGGRPPVEKRLE